MSLDDLFSKLAMSTVQTVSRIAINHATNAAIRNVTSYLVQQVNPQQPKSAPTREIEALQRQLDLKIKNLKPAIDKISYSVSNGNEDLAPALEMCTDLQLHIDSFVKDTKDIDQADMLLLRLKQLVAYVDDTVPFLNLSLRSIDAGQVLVSKLLQASHLLHHSDQPSFVVTLYSLFAANARPASADWDCTWKEEARKAHLLVTNCPKKDSGQAFDYQLVLTEDWDDGLYHDEAEDKARSWTWSVDRVDRMYYTRASQLLNLDNQPSQPVLVVKLRKSTKEADSPPSTPRLNVEQTNHPNVTRNDLDHFDWYALQVYDTSSSKASSEDGEDEAKGPNTDLGKTNVVPFPMTLLLLESTIKLALLESHEQMNHLQASDDLLSSYMGSTLHK
ncbi:hypothetical protein DM01DRAFT_1196079 [Hesseltinella vesiculosa]|uniref:Ran-binding-domain-containing protein n=1 Tax=Hesseltinella vesiculosa TaxID=101127 RepID=A0A1X2G3I6_9FUNG|nr:hypothetical protein DM01DRAFT_1196079 [Hesseltinella vesiculosa]